MSVATNNEWTRICALTDIPMLGSRVVNSAAHGDIAVFRTHDDAVFAVHDKCPHQGGPLSQGIVHGRTVTCPLHSWKVQLDNGEALAPDIGCTKRFDVRVTGGEVYLSV
jgi:nitrite reductase (NADH) small subunit